MRYLLVFFLIAIAQAAEGPVKFDPALEEIIQRSTAVGVQESNLNATRARALPAKLFLFPSISADATQTSTDTANTLNQGQTSRQLQATARMNLFRFGADLSALHAANADIDAQEALYRNEVLRTEEAAVQALIDKIQKTKRIEIIRKILNTQSELLSIARQRYDRGLLPQQEVDKVSVDLENAKASLVDAQVEETNARAGLLNLLGHANIENEWPWKDRIQKQAKELSAKGFSVQKRPDWQAAKSQLEAEEQRTSQNWRLLLPSVDGSFSYGYYNALGVSGPGWTGTLGITVPLFDRLTNYSNARAQASVRAAAEYRLEQTQRSAQSDWEYAKSRFELSLQTAMAREQTVSVSRKLYVDNLRRFRGGKIDANDLVVDQKRLFDSEQLAIDGWSTAHLAYSQLCHALSHRIRNCLEN